MNKKALLKLVAQILQNPKQVDLATLRRLLEAFGYECRQPRGGSSHYVFRKAACQMITVPMHKPVKVVYVKAVIRELELEAWYEKENA
ncbi:MAG TPA: type II toxin-antitoxin system HicA family toxin [bacterium]|jgi:predicted RNA binding protein YcfA (HicA-like mRNA interferase family)|nr:type II toxin-antitoxin system HicA family toxin [bacterium]